MVYKLKLTGYVKGRPTKKVTSYYSWPHGLTEEEASPYYTRFSNSFRDACFEIIEAG